MPIILCPDKITCPCDTNPFANLSSEAPDQPVFLANSFQRARPPLGTAFEDLECFETCDSTISPDAAELCAAQLGFECAISTWTTGVNGSGGGGGPASPVPPPVAPHGANHVQFFHNTVQMCEVICPDGLPFTYTVAAGLFSALSQAAADAMALSYACRQATLHQVCFGSVTPNPCCVNEQYSGTVTASGRFLAVAPQADQWSMTGGALPPGLVFNGGSITGGVATITGTPTQPGVFTFFVQIVTPSGDAMEKGFTIFVAGLTNGNSLPVATVGTAYTATLTATGFSSPSFTLAGGSLPDGLSMDASGNIMGTPTSAVPPSVMFTVQIVDGVTGFGCEDVATIAVTSTPFNIDWSNYFTIPNGGSVSGTFSPNSFDLVSAMPSTGTGSSVVNNDSNATPQSYTGPGANWNLHLVITTDASAYTLLVFIQQDASILVFESGAVAAGTYDIPFSFAAGVNSQIKVEVRQTLPVPGAGTVHLEMSGIITQI